MRNMAYLAGGGLFVSFLRSSSAVLSKRGDLIAIFNVIYFCSIFVVVLIAQFLLPPPLYLDEPLLFSGIIGLLCLWGSLFLI